MSDRVFTIIASLITLSLSTLISILSYIANRHITLNHEKYMNFYKPFYALYISIHEGRALDFTHLSKNDQNRIMDFLIQNRSYVNKQIDIDVYSLMCSRQNNFNNNSKDNIKTANISYRRITDYMISKEHKLRNKYTSKK